MNYEEKRRIEAIIEAFSEQFGLPCRLVEGGPATAWYDGEAVYVSRLNLLKMMERMTDKDIKFLIYHESGHAKFSDVKVLKAINAIKKEAEYGKEGISAVGAETIMNFTQSLEDIRVETEMSKLYDGIDRELRTRIKGVVDANESEMLQQLGEINPRSIALATYMKYRYKKFYETKVPEPVKKIVEEIADLTDALPAAKTSWDVMKMAKKIYQRTKKYYQNKKQPPEDMMKSMSSKSSGTGTKPPTPGKDKEEKEEKEKETPGGGDKEEEKEEEEKGEEGGKEKTEEKEEEKEEKEKKGGGEGEDEEEDEEKPDPIKAGVQKEMEGDSGEILEAFEKEVREEADMIEPSSKEDMSVLPEVPIKMSIEFDIADTYPIVAEAKANDEIEVVKNKCLGEYERLRAELGVQIKQMQREVKDMFIHKKASRFRSGFKSGGMISARDLWRTATGETKVFMRRKEQEKVDYAITVLIDQSGSMSGTKIREAKKSLIALSEVLNEIGVPFEVLGFSTQGHSRGGPELPDEIRHDHLLHMIYKEFDEPFSSAVKGRIGTIDSHHNNWDGEAIMWAYKRMMSNPAQEKLLIVLSDGQPSGAESSKKNCSFTRAVIKNIQKKIKVIGIGYLTTSVRDFYKDYILVEDVAELPKTFCKLLYKVLSVGYRSAE